jgi:DNA-binding NtrC family response regulator
MTTQGLHLFIVDDNLLSLTSLRDYLDIRFGKDLNISTFLSGAKALEKVDKNTSVVILDYDLKGENGNDVLQSIKKINPKTEVIMFSSNEEIGVAIDSFRKGASNYVIKDDKGWKKISHLVLNIITYPVRILVQEFRVTKFVAIFILTFVAMALVVYLALKYIW